MSLQNDPRVSEDEGQHYWYVLEQEGQRGPFHEAQLLRLLLKRRISPTLPARPAQAQVFRPLCEWPTFVAACSGLPGSMALSPAAQSGPTGGFPLAAALKHPRLGWDPRVVGWLGVLFSPLWAAIVAAINSRRLKTSLPIWRPLAIGIGATSLDVLIDLLVESYLIDLILYGGALWLIWYLDLRRQSPYYRAQQAACGRQGGWWVPVLTGVPAAILVIIGFIVVPLLPLQPREVCQRFIDAKSLSQAQRDTTLNLWPALARFYSLPDRGAFNGKFELTDEAPGRYEIDGYFVGWRQYVDRGRRAFTIEGAFQLVNYEGQWKINEWLIMIPQEGQPEPNCIAISRDYALLFPEPEPRPSPTVNGDGGTTNWGDLRRGLIAGTRLMNAAEHKLPALAAKTEATASKAWKGIVAAIVAIGAAISGIFRSIFGANTGGRVPTDRTQVRSST